MLALTRKKGESIIIGDNIEMVVLGITGEQVRLGVIAPKTISVHRKEIFEQIRNENKEATMNAKDKLKNLGESFASNKGGN
ncbi:MAG: carbon storage regulator CsrA [Defluviitaleaceae bacterium]|nr:carbon storage regulator CsrA [Defluviitaleaceae bacterium]MCL2263992.1 carbon storage regulator CsrA [Defluviitaleaceae bacterium]